MGHVKGKLNMLKQRFKVPFAHGDEWHRKLRNPRIYDRRKVKNPTERLKMPWFNFTEDEIEAITCFVAGLVEDEVQNAKMVPSAEQLSMNDGLRAIRQKNCAGCHVIEPALAADPKQIAAIKALIKA